jgi:hypothetical protein
LGIDKDGAVADPAWDAYECPAYLAANESTMHDEWLLTLVLSRDGEQHNSRSG